MSSSISLSECLDVINVKDKEGNSFPFNIDVWTLNRFSKSGGDLRRYKDVKLLARTKQTVNEESLKISASILPKPKKKANHFLNRTRNIELPNGAIKKIHIRLIDNINGKKVVF